MSPAELKAEKRPIWTDQISCDMVRSHTQSNRVLSISTEVIFLALLVCL